MISRKEVRLGLAGGDARFIRVLASAHIAWSELHQILVRYTQGTLFGSQSPPRCSVVESEKRQIVFFPYLRLPCSPAVATATRSKPDSIQMQTRPIDTL